MTASEKLRAALAGATAGPWVLNGIDVFDPSSDEREWVITCGEDNVKGDALVTVPTGVCEGYDEDMPRKADAHLIVLAVNALPALADVVEAAEKALADREVGVGPLRGRVVIWQEDKDALHVALGKVTRALEVQDA